MAKLLAIAALWSSGVSAPPPNASIPHEPQLLAQRVSQTAQDLRAAIDRWRGQRNPAQSGPPEEVTLDALYQQRIYILLAANPRLATTTLRRLPPQLALGAARDDVLARRELGVFGGRGRWARSESGGLSRPTGCVTTTGRASGDSA